MSDLGERASADPLFETLFRGSPASPGIASAAPVPSVGTHSRAGNAMGRTRTALLVGAARAVAADGTKITMSQVATCAGVAKATLYNHFRTRDAVLAALLEHEVRELIESIGRTERRPLEATLIGAATEVSNHPVLRALASREPGTLAGLARVDPRSPGWRAAREALDAVLQEAGCGGTSVVLRWLASYLVTPGDAGAIFEDARIVVAGLPALAAVAPSAPSVPSVQGANGAGVAMRAATPLSA